MIIAFIIIIFLAILIAPMFQSPLSIFAGLLGVYLVLGGSKNKDKDKEK